jgi:hypothetical protein
MGGRLRIIARRILAAALGRRADPPLTVEGHLLPAIAVDATAETGEPHVVVALALDAAPTSHVVRSKVVAKQLAKLGRADLGARVRGMPPAGCAWFVALFPDRVEIELNRVRAEVHPCPL